MRLIRFNQHSELEANLKKLILKFLDFVGFRVFCSVHLKISILSGKSRESRSFFFSDSLSNDASYGAQVLGFCPTEDNFLQSENRRTMQR